MILHIKFCGFRVTQMVQLIKTPSAKPDDLSLSLKTHMIEEKN